MSGERGAIENRSQQRERLTIPDSFQECMMRFGAVLNSQKFQQGLIEESIALDRLTLLRLVSDTVALH